MNADALLLEMRDITRAAALPLAPGESVKAQIRRAAWRLDLTCRRAEALWYGQARQVLAEEADRLRRWADARAAARRRELMAEIAALDQRQTALARNLAEERTRAL